MWVFDSNHSSDWILWAISCLSPLFLSLVPCLCVSCSKIPGCYLDYVHSSNYTNNLSCHGFCHSCLSSSISLLSNTFFWALAHINTPLTFVTSWHNNTSSVSLLYVHFLLLILCLTLQNVLYLFCYVCCSVSFIVCSLYNNLMLLVVSQFLYCQINHVHLLYWMHWEYRCLNSYDAFNVFQCRIKLSFIYLKQFVAALSLGSIILPSCLQSVCQIHCMMSFADSSPARNLTKTHQHQQQSPRINKEHWPQQWAERDSPPHTLQ